MKIANLKLVELAEGNYHIFVSAKVNGNKVLFIVDTGASGSVIDKDYYSKKLAAKHKTIQQEVHGLHSTQHESYVGKLKTLEVGKLTLKNFSIGCIDLSHINGAYKSRKLKLKIHGIIGSDLLLKHGIIIDYKKLELRQD